MTTVTVPFLGSLYSPKSILKQSAAIAAGELNLVLLCRKLCALLAQEMQLSSVDIVLSPDYENPSLAPLLPQAAADAKRAALAKLITTIKSPRLVHSNLNPLDKQQLVDLKVEAIIPLNIGEEAVGLLVLGPKLGTLARYTSSDIKFLMEFGAQAARSLKNANSYRKIQEFNRTLEIKVIERTHQLEELQAAQLKLKDEFVFIATHDLATPVASIVGFLSLINKQSLLLPEEIKSYLSAIGEACDRLNALVKDLLEVARSDSGTVKIELVQVDVGKLLTVAIKQALPLAAEKQVNITLDLAQDNLIQADPKKLAEVIENLISNGIKYNKEGGSLHIATTPQGEHLRIEFSDTGLGIATPEQPKIFTKFFRSESSTIRQQSGTGLGLFVVRMLTEKMGGKVTFKSQEGEGTTFWLEFSK